jgi:hypothetical protein
MPERTFVIAGGGLAGAKGAEALRNDSGPRSARGSIQSSCATGRFPLEQLGAAASLESPA